MGNKNFADTMAINRSDKQDDGLDAMFPATPQAQAPARYANQKTETKDGRKQITFKLPAATIDKLRAYSYWMRSEQWQVVDDALSEMFSRHEKIKGKIKPIPTKNK